MNDMTFGIKLTADGKQLVSEVNQSTDSFNRLSAAARSVQVDAAKLNTSHNEMAKSMNTTQDSSERLNISLERQNAAMNQTVVVMRQATSAQEESSVSVTKLLDRYDQQGAKVRKLQGDFDALNRAAMNGAVGTRDDGRLDMVYAKIKAEIGGASGAVENFSGTAVDGMNKTSHASAGVTRELIVMGHEAMSGNFSRMPGSVMVLAERMNWMMGPIALVTGALFAGYEAWKLWGKQAVEMDVVSKSVHDVTTSVVDDLNKQITLINERNRLMKQGVTGSDESVAQIARLNSFIRTDKLALGSWNMDSPEYAKADRDLKMHVEERARLLAKMKEQKTAQDELERSKSGNNEQKNDAWVANERAKIEVLNAEAESGKKLNEAQKSLIELREKQKYGATALPADVYKTKESVLLQADAAEQNKNNVEASNKIKEEQRKHYDNVIKSGRERVAVLNAEAGSTQALTQSEKDLAKFKQDVADGTVKLSEAEIAGKQSSLELNAANEKQAASLNKLRTQYDANFKNTFSQVFEPNTNVMEVAGKNFGQALKKSVTETFTSSLFQEPLKKFTDNMASSISNVLGQMGGGKSATPTDWAGAALAVAAAASIAFSPQASAAQLKMVNAGYMQQMQGTGSVTGEALTQSHSISDSLKLLSSTATMGNNYTQQMLVHLKSVDVSMSSFVTAAAKSIGMDIATTMGVLRSSSSSSISTNWGYSPNSGNGIEGGLKTWVGSALGTILGGSKIAQPVSDMIFGKDSTTVTDTGLNITGTLGQLAKGKGVQTYVSGTNSNSGLFGTGIGGSSDTFTKYGNASADLASSFANIYTGIKDSFKSAGSAMGKDMSTVDSTFNNFTTTIGKLSFEGMNATQKYQALDAAISKDADTLARTLFPEIVKFNVAGEGMDKTLIRVITENAVVVTALNQMGNAQVQAGRSSFDLTNSLVQAAGSLDKLLTSTQTFSKFYTTQAQQQDVLYASAKNQFSGTVLDGLVNSKTTATQIAAYVNTAMNSGIDANSKVRIIDAANSFSSFLTSVKAGIDQLRQSYDAVISSRDAVVGSIKNLQQFNVTMQDFRRQVVTDNSLANPTAKYADAKKYFDDISAKAAAGDSVAQSKLQSASQALLSTSMSASGSYSQYQRDYNSVLKAVDNTMSYNDTLIKNGKDMLSALDTQNNISAQIQANTFDTRLQTLDLAKNMNGYATASAQFALQTSIASDAAKSALTDYITKNDANMSTLIGGVTQSVNGVASSVGAIQKILDSQPAVLASIITADKAAITEATNAAMTAISQMAIPAIQVAVTQAAQNAVTPAAQPSGGSGVLNHVGDVLAGTFGWSDPRLKENITQVGKTNYGLNLYDFNYIGGHDRYRGVMSTEVRRAMPSAVTTQNGYDAVNYGMLGIKMVKVGGSFEVGSNYVPHDMVANIHEGEKITPKPFVDLEKAARNETNSLLSRLVASNAELRDELKRLSTNQQRDNAEIKSSTAKAAQILDEVSAGGGPMLVKVTA